MLALQRRFLLPSRALALAVVCGLTVAACSGPAFVDSRREAGSVETVGASSLDRPVVCYSVRNTTPDQVVAMANEVCARDDKVALYRASDWLECTLMQPRRAIFECVDPGTAGAGVMPHVDTGRASSGRRDGGTIRANPATPGFGFEGWEGGIYPDGQPPGLPRP